LADGRTCRPSPAGSSHEGKLDQHQLRLLGFLSNGLNRVRRDCALVVAASASTTTFSIPLAAQGRRPRVPRLIGARVGDPGASSARGPGLGRGTLGESAWWVRWPAGGRHRAFAARCSRGSSTLRLRDCPGRAAWCCGHPSRCSRWRVGVGGHRQAGVAARPAGRHRVPRWPPCASSTPKPARVLSRRSVGLGFLWTRAEVADAIAGKPRRPRPGARPTRGGGWGFPWRVR